MSFLVFVNRRKPSPVAISLQKKGGGNSRLQKKEINDEAWTVAIMGMAATLVVVLTLACIYTMSGSATKRRGF